MNDRVSEVLLAEASGRGAAEVIDAASGAVITAAYKGKSYSFRADGWFNATEAAKRYGRDAHEWVRLPDTKRYLAALERTYGKIPHVETSRARADRGGGTWLNPKLAVKFARWLDVDFEVWCDMLIDQILRGALPPAVEDRLTTAGERMPFLFAALHSLDRRGTSVTVFYRAVNKAAGSAKFSKMTISQRSKVLPMAERINHHIDTQEDWRLLHDSGLKLSGQQAQLALPLHAPPAED